MSTDPIGPPSFRQVGAVIFDAVGTLIHPDPPAAAVYAAVGQRFGSRRTAADIVPRFRSAFARQEQADRENGWRTSEPREERRWRQIVAEVLDDAADPEACFQELFAHFGRPEAWRCGPEAGPVVRELAARGYLVGLASNYDRRLHAVRAGLPELSPLRPVLLSSEVAWRKPAAAFFDALCRTIALPARQLLFVGDDLVNDCEGAQAAGLQTLLFDPERKASDCGRKRIERLSELLSLMAPRW